jgi:hypothetical protein
MMAGQDELSARAAEPHNPCAVLHRALRVLLPVRETSRGRPGNERPIPLTLRNLSTVLTAADRLLTSDTLPVDHFNHDSWPYVTSLKEEATHRADALNYYVISEHVGFVIAALTFTCLRAGCDMPNDLPHQALSTRRRVVTERIEPQQRRRGTAS